MSEFLEKVNAELVECQGKLKANMSEESKAAQELQNFGIAHGGPYLKECIGTVLAELAEAKQQFTASQVGEALQQVILLKKQLAAVTENFKDLAERDLVLKQQLAAMTAETESKAAQELRWALMLDAHLDSVEIRPMVESVLAELAEAQRQLEKARIGVGANNSLVAQELRKCWPEVFDENDTSEVKIKIRAVLAELATKGGIIKAQDESICAFLDEVGELRQQLAAVTAALEPVSELINSMRRLHTGECDCTWCHNYRRLEKLKGGN